VQQGNAGFSASGLLGGLISPGTYEFYGLTQLHDDHDQAASTVASGFTRLTLTAFNAAAAPEPASLAVWSLLPLAFATASCRRRGHSELARRTRIAVACDLARPAPSLPIASWDIDDCVRKFERLASMGD
jgi:hypothetical protein